MRVLAWLTRWMMWCSVLLAWPVCFAQEAAPPPVTLNVYTDLLQIPVLVLDAARRPVAGLRPKQFRVSVDSGPMFQPPYIRREGDDAIALTVLVDTHELGAGMEARFAAALGGLAERSLGARDRVVIEALNGCEISRTQPFAVTTAAALQAKVATVLNTDAAAGSGCEGSLQLRDAIAKACVALEKEDGRRVLLVVANGADRGSRISWKELRHVATTRSVAIFAVSMPPVAPRSWKAGAAAASTPAEPEALSALCALTGGVLSWSDAAGMRGAMDNVLRMVRERYILEFERPARLELGQHDLAVKVSGSLAMVLAAGISFPRVGADERDPTGTASGDSVRSPEPGTRRILDAPQPH